MGDKVWIRVVAANLEKRQLDYEWVIDGAKQAAGEVAEPRLQNEKSKNNKGKKDKPFIPKKEEVVAVQPVAESVPAAQLPEEQRKKEKKPAAKKKETTKGAAPKKSNKKPKKEKE
jgi:ribonuclease R